MSTIKSKKLQVGTDATSSNNFTIYQPATPDGTLRIGVGNADSPTEVARVTSDGIADANGQLLSNTPAFSIRTSANQTLSDLILTKVQFDTKEFDTDNAFDSTTNYRFTVPTGKAGIYLFNSMARIDSEGTGNLGRSQLFIYQNGSVIKRAYPYYADGFIRSDSIQISALLNLDVGDYIEMYAYIDAIDNTGGVINSNQYTFFSGHKLIT